MTQSIQTQQSLKSQVSSKLFGSKSGSTSVSRSTKAAISSRVEAAASTNSSQANGKVLQQDLKNPQMYQSAVGSTGFHRPVTSFHQKSPSAVSQRAVVGGTRINGASKDTSHSSSNNSGGHLAPKTTALKSPGKSFQPQMASSGKNTRSNKM